MNIFRMEAGFTAIELLVTVSVMAILAALAAPNFKLLIERWRVRNSLELMQSTLYLARSEAIKRGGRIAIQKLPNTPASCSLASANEEWGCGWFVFADDNSDGKWQAAEARLHTVNTPANTNVIHQGGGQSIKVDRYGMMSGLNAKGFVFSPEPDGVSSTATLGLCMSSGGRIRVIKEVPCT
jgi:type IV fimbrial biogenesis protein FimT